MLCNRHLRCSFARDEQSNDSCLQAEVQAEVCSSLKTVDKVEPKAGVEDRQGQVDDGSKGGKGASGTAEAKPESHMGNSEDRRKGSHLRDQSVGLDTRPGKRERACKHAPPQRRPEGFSREPLTKRLDKPPSSRQSQVEPFLHAGYTFSFSLPARGSPEDFKF